jgi:predicted DNA-binding antitoxin AbrB/MazE fold protein
MTTTVRAVYKDGVLRPDKPLPFANGAAVDVLMTPVPAEDEVLQRMRAATTLDELFAIADSLPPEDDGYDLCKALNENRRAAGEPLLYPNLESETRP